MPSCPNAPKRSYLEALSARTHRYRLTAKGLLLTAARQATRRANIKDLLKVA